MQDNDRSKEGGKDLILPTISYRSLDVLRFSSSHFINHFINSKSISLSVAGDAAPPVNEALGSRGREPAIGILRWRWRSDGGAAEGGNPVQKKATARSITKVSSLDLKRSWAEFPHHKTREQLLPCKHAIGCVPVQSLHTWKYAI